MPKSTKAIKVSDGNKAWNKKAKPGAYSIETIPIKKTILIVCEGQTEEMYFKSFPVLTEYRVKTYNTQGQAKLKLVEFTKGIKDSFDIKFDEIWCVFDMDVKGGEKEFADFDNAITKALQLRYKVAYSNDAFELWFYLHYNYTDSQHLRSFYYKELGNRFRINYVKDGKKYDFCKKIYGILMDDENASQEKAIEKARALFEKQKSLLYHQQNPNTKVYELVEELNKNLR